jgi:cytochrome P450
MTHSSFPTPQHDSDASLIRVDEPSAGGRAAGPMVGCPVDRGAIEGRSLLGATDPAAVADPYPRYARLRAANPVHRTPDGLWILTRHADVAAVLRDPRFGREGFERHFGASGPSTPNDDGLASSACPATGGHRQSMLFRDPPHHARLRDAVSRAFTPRAVEALRPRVQAILLTLPLRFSIQEGPEGRTCRRGEGSGEVCDRFERSTT